VASRLGGCKERLEPKEEFDGKRKKRRRRKKRRPAGDNPRVKIDLLRKIWRTAASVWPLAWGCSAPLFFFCLICLDLSMSFVACFSLG